MEKTTGKWQHQVPLSASVAGHSKKPQAFSSIFRIYDFVSGMNYLVDMGSQISILPASKWDKENCVKSNSLVAAKGNRLMTLRFGVECFRWNFVVADVTQPILGADFLCAHSLMVDVKGRRLFNIKKILLLFGRHLITLRPQEFLW